MRTILVLGVAACGPPPVEAPEELGELGRFLFEHFDDEDPRAMEAGLANLDDFLATEDYTVPPSDRALTMPHLLADRLGGLTVPEGVSTEDQVSVAIAGVSAFALDDQVTIMVDPNQTCLESNITQWAGRTFLTDVDCFTAGTCDVLETITAVRRSLSVFLDVWYDQLKTYRRFSVRRDDGADIAVIVGRAWIEEVFEGEGGGTSMDQLFHLDAYVEGVDDQVTMRWFSMWSSVSGLPVGDDIYRGLVVSGLEEALEFGDAYLGNQESDCRHDRDAPKPERPR